ncbi:cytochrome P460 family protein [Roseicella frigidaeris]|uniref:Cytochrome C oxidase subunit III n=1 Tax=Roseicella frigidaeris TaxID=2230885 RepID=A0A327LWQ1_9PROT|nr:cytochrome P460 family protein [Roseicella frigidaeris]RAI54603.1 cytochrome C oxidase subunit III [Roseicella frigidaeris]
MLRPYHALVLLLLTLPAAGTTRAASEAPAAPLYGVTLPEGYRRWELIAPAQETAPLDELRAALGNDIAMAAYRAGTLPFPDGSVLVKLAWRHQPSAEYPPAFVPGAATTVQVMVKDSRRYAGSGGWGFGRFTGGVPADEAQHETCFACHAERVRDHDRVFTRLAP